MMMIIIIIMVMMYYDDGHNNDDLYLKHFICQITISNWSNYCHKSHSYPVIQLTLYNNQLSQYHRVAIKIFAEMETFFIL